MCTYKLCTSLSRVLDTTKLSNYLKLRSRLSSPVIVLEYIQNGVRHGTILGGNMRNKNY